MNATPERSPQKDPELTALETNMRSLRPRGDWLDRERLMYRAGQASVSAQPAPRPPSLRATLLRPAATAVSWLLALTFGLLLIQREMASTSGIETPIAQQNASRDSGTTSFATTKPNRATNIAADHASAPSIASGRSKKLRDDYLRLRQLVVNKGLDAMPPPTGASRTSAKPNSEPPESRSTYPYRDALKRLLDS